MKFSRNEMVSGLQRLLFIMLVTTATACSLMDSQPATPAASDSTEAFVHELDNYLVSVINTHEIPGLAVAVVSNGQVRYERYFGNTSLDTEAPIAENTLFRLYSLSKLMTSVAVFQLIEEGKLSLDDTLDQHFNDLPVAWQSVRIGNLLSHSSGLPDVRGYTSELSDNSLSDLEFIRLIYNDAMEFPTGSDWNYNQTNFLLLKEIIETESGMRFEDVVLSRQFPTATRLEALFSSDPDEYIPTRARYYDFDRKASSYRSKPEFPGVRSHPLNGVNLTLGEYIAWNQRLDQNELLSEASKELMFTEFNFSNSDRNFLYGWDVYTVNGHPSFGFSGGGVSGYRKFVDRDLTIFVLSTGYRHYAVQDIIIDTVAGMMDSELKDQVLVLSEEVLTAHVLSGQSVELDELYDRVKSQYPGQHLDKVMKAVGYKLFFNLDRQPQAIELFKRNIKEYPDAYDVYGSLGYLYFLDKQFEPARVNYVKALELNPQNPYSQRMIKRIDELLRANN